MYQTPNHIHKPEQYKVNVTVTLVDDEDFKAMFKLHWGYHRTNEIAFTVMNDNIDEAEIFVKKEYGQWQEPSSEDIGHEVKHIIQRLYWMLYQQYRFSPDCGEWVERNEE